MLAAPKSWLKYTTAIEKLLALWLFLFIFRRLLLISGVKSPKKVWNEQKKVEKRLKKCFDELLGARSTQKLVKIHNSHWKAAGTVSLPKYVLRDRFTTRFKLSFLIWSEWDKRECYLLYALSQCKFSKPVWLKCFNFGGLTLPKLIVYSWSPNSGRNKIQNLTFTNLLLNHNRYLNSSLLVFRLRPNF